MGDIVSLSADFLERRARLEFLRAGRDAMSGDPYGEELAQIEAELEKQEAQLRSYVDELVALGVELKGLADGLVDFPCRLDGRLVFLCWKYGEPEVLHWHELDGGFAGRQPLIAASVAGDGSAGRDEAV